MTGPKTSDWRERKDRNSSGTAPIAGDLGRYLFCLSMLFSQGQTAPNAPFLLLASKEACKTQ